MVIFKGRTFVDFAVRLSTQNIHPRKNIVLKEAQCIQLDDQRKLNRENPFVFAFHEIYVPRKLSRIRYLLHYITFYKRKYLI